MARVKSRDTRPEAALRKALWREGLRYRTYASALPGKPDIVLASPRLAVFVDGDFWHGHQWVRRGLNSLEEQFQQAKNAVYWIRKIKRNAARDVTATVSLLDAGWTVLRFWESDIRQNLQGCVNTVLDTIAQGQAEAAGAFPRPKVAEFFSGIGLMRLGLERTGWHVVFANDIDPQKCDIYRQNFGDDGHLSPTDINQLHGDDVPDCTLATASFPCNDLSLAGKYAGLRGQRSGTFFAFTRLLREMGARKPRLVLIENVPGFLNSHGGDDLAAAVGELNNLGYCCDAFMIDAADFVPQSRKRLFIVGSQGDAARRDRRSVADTPESSVRPRRLLKFMMVTPELDWNIRRCRRLSLVYRPSRTCWKTCRATRPGGGAKSGPTTWFHNSANRTRPSPSRWPTTPGTVMARYFGACARGARWPNYALTEPLAACERRAAAAEGRLS